MVGGGKKSRRDVLLADGGRHRSAQARLNELRNQNRGGRGGLTCVVVGDRGRLDSGWDRARDAGGAGGDELVHDLRRSRTSETGLPELRGRGNRRLPALLSEKLDGRGAAQCCSARHLVSR